MTDATACTCGAAWCGRDAAQGRMIGIYLDPPMAIARVGRSPEPMDAYGWVIDENPHRGVQTKIVPALSLRLSSSLPYLVVFTPPLREYFCVEPVGHVSNAIHMSDPAEHGLQSVAPRATVQAWMKLDISAARG